MFLYKSIVAKIVNVRIRGGIKIARSSAERIGSVMGGKEKALVFEQKYENTGFVEFINKRQGAFHLMPSIIPTPADEYRRKTIYVCDTGEKPFEGDFIEVSVRETAQEHKPIGKAKKPEYTTIDYKFVKEWSYVDLNTVKGNKNICLDEFFNFLNLPFYGDYGTTGIAEGFGLYTVSCPPIVEFTQGGINTLIQSKFYDNEKRGAVGKIMSIVPPEFTKLQCRNLYKLLESPLMVYSPESLEVNLSWFNLPAIPPHIPITINNDVKPFKQYKENYNYYLLFAQSFMIDALFYQPKVSDVNMKKFEEGLYEMRDVAWKAAGEGGFNFNLDGTVRIAMAFARLFSQTEVTGNVIKGAVETYEKSLNSSKWSAGAAVNLKGNPKLKSYYERPAEDRTVLSSIEQLIDTGQKLTITNLNKICEIKGDRLMEILYKLSRDGFIYFPGEDRIGLLK